MVFSMVGATLVVVDSVATQSQESLFFIGFFLIAIGAGTIPNLLTLGADQFDLRYSQDRQGMDHYYSW